MTIGKAFFRCFRREEPPSSLSSLQSENKVTTLAKSKFPKTPDDWIHYVLQVGRVSVNPAFVPLIRYLDRVNGPLQHVLRPVLPKPPLAPKSAFFEEMYTSGRRAIEERYKAVEEKNTNVHKIRINSSTIFNIVPKEITEDVLPSTETILTKKGPINLSITEKSIQDKTPFMEDKNFILHTNSGTLVATFVGLKGDQLAEQIISLFYCGFKDCLRKANNDVGKAFKALFKKVHEHSLKSRYLSQGTATTLCYIDHSTHAVYTAKRGKNQARIYRGNEGTIAIPLSLETKWARVEPELSVNMLQPNDILILATPGLWNFTPDDEIASEISEAIEDNVSIADSLAFHSSVFADATENITVLAIEVKNLL